MNRKSNKQIKLSNYSLPEKAAMIVIPMALLFAVYMLYSIMIISQ